MTSCTRPDSRLQHAPGVFRVARFAENLLADHHGRIGADHDDVGGAAQRLERARGLLGREPFDVRTRRLARLMALIDIRRV